MENKTIWVESKAEFPSWQKPCPNCGAKYPDPAISHRKDESAAWCKRCGLNWKISQYSSKGSNPVPGWEKPVKQPITAPQSDINFQQFVADEFKELNRQLEELKELINNK